MKSINEIVKKKKVGGEGGANALPLLQPSCFSCSLLHSLNKSCLAHPSLPPLNFKPQSVVLSPFSDSASKTPWKTWEGPGMR